MNNINTISKEFLHLSLLDQTFLKLIFDHRTGTTSIIPFDDLIHCMSFFNLTEPYNHYKSFLKNFTQNTVFSTQTEDGFQVIPLIQHISIECYEINIHLHPIIEHLPELPLGLFQFELKYTSHLFLYLYEHRTQPVPLLNGKELHKLFNLPENKYKKSPLYDISRFILDPACKEINSAQNCPISVSWIKQTHAGQSWIQLQIREKHP